MNLLKTINPEKVDENNIPDWEYRKAARAVVFDNEGRIGLLNVSGKDYYKLPGGGVEEGEDIKTALDRECEEELGVEIEVLTEVGSIIEYRAKWKLHQTSYCFLARTSSDKNAPNFTDEERSSGFEIVWVEPKEALRLLNLKKTSDYEGKFIEERDFCLLNEALKSRASLGK
ncbi:MAG: ADP-ribose pyrophosphatase [Candidatus Nealsonbacteria bacterium CG_4_10_14_0_2_um_filter_38_17]|uniref:ADP-ribose pyrophosphatase n=2 Tax=Candidatus Nealsoniibacteriota TaxID=1817911 RepID=A0A2M7UX94_9BACT|nr:MAG: ADP-ribose pyrophosphatase [Candidatus Nealsonbacteria bacterium CG23_combo_of_CG06-09_8_20_14_all_38_19]PIZ88589.1 MAG: ADP-ribose pyrophosphatase [Candidatus Nealsonbacteria bacterium CG_4_10_14_0_2_um_filter_38_17]